MKKFKINDRVKVKDPAWPWENDYATCVSNQVFHVGKEVCMIKFDNSEKSFFYSVEYLEKHED